MIDDLGRQPSIDAPAIDLLNRQQNKTKQPHKHFLLILPHKQNEKESI